MIHWRPRACPVEVHVRSYDEVRPLSEEATALCGGDSRSLLLRFDNDSLEATGLSRGGSRSQLQRATTVERRGHRLVRWSVTFAATNRLI